MKHFTTKKYWQDYNQLPPNVKRVADKNLSILKQNHQHPSLNLKKIKQYWSIRAGLNYRALGVDTPDKEGIVWFWIGSHKEYERLLNKI